MLAEISQSEAMMIVLVGLSGLAGIVVTLLKLKTAIVNEIKGQVKADTHEPAPSVNVLPSPLQVQGVEKFATAGAFSRHVAADREEHEKLREQTLTLEREIGHKLHVVKDEIMKAGNEREDRLAKKIDTHHETERGRVDKLMEGFGEIKGMLHHVLNISGGGKGGAK